jgi:hypothetical protein
MAPVAALAAGFSVIRRHVPRLLARRFRVCLEAPAVRADHRPPALQAGEQKLKAERNPIRPSSIFAPLRTRVRVSLRRSCI